MHNIFKLFSIKKINFFYSLIIFELSLLVFAILLGFGLKVYWWQTSWNWHYFLWFIGGLFLLIGLSLILSIGAINDLYFFKWYKPYLYYIFLPLIRLLPANSYWLVALLAAVGEEAMFRGVMQNNLGLVFTAIIFAFLHAPPIPSLIPLTVIYLFMSFILGIIYFYTSNIYLLMSIHFIYNWVILIKLNQINLQFKS